MRSRLLAVLLFAFALFVAPAHADTAAASPGPGRPPQGVLPAPDFSQPAGHADAQRGFWHGFAEPLEHFVKGVTLILARLIELFAGLIVGIAAFRAILAYFAGLPRRPGADNPPPEVRLALGRSLALALELEMGADILMTAVAPTWNDIGQLAAIAVLRTALNHFLEKELQATEAHRGAHVEARDASG